MSFAGITPVAVQGYPLQLAALNRSYLSVAELTVRAAFEQRTDHILHAAILDPNTAATLALPDIARLCDEMIEAHRESLPWASRRTHQYPGADDEYGQYPTPSVKDEQ